MVLREGGHDAIFFTTAFRPLELRLERMLSAQRNETFPWRVSTARSKQIIA